MSDGATAHNPAILALSGVVRRYHQGGRSLEVLKGVDLAIARGEIVGLVGQSGAGKSTLLHAAGLLERPDGGQVLVNGTDVTRLGDAARTTLRRRTIGFVYQFHPLLPEFSAAENIILSQMLGGISKSDASNRASQLLARVGLGERAGHRPAELSGGEQQRVAIARALANAPPLLLADEPTGNLDAKTAGGVFDMLTALVRETGMGALIATHNPGLARAMDRVVALEDGVLKPG